MLERVPKGPRRVRTLFVSDVHLGTKGCQADKLLDFLRRLPTETRRTIGIGALTLGVTLIWLAARIGG